MTNYPHNETLQQAVSSIKNHYEAAMIGGIGLALALNELLNLGWFIQ